MRFRRRKDKAPEGEAETTPEGEAAFGSQAPPAAEPDTHGADAWRVPGTAPVEDAATEFRPPEVPGEVPAAGAPAPDPEPAIDSEAVELPDEPDTGEVPAAEAAPPEEQPAPPEPGPEAAAPPPPPPPEAAAPPPPEAEPTPVVGVADSSAAYPPGSAAPSGNGAFAPAAASGRPEVLAGAAFAGGLVAALILKRLVD